MTIKNDIVDACNVWYGEYVDSDVCNLSSNETPEHLYLMKENLNRLSKEAKMVTKIIANLPDEMFTKSGRLLRGKFIIYMQENFKWSAQKTKIVQDELSILLD